MNTLPQIKIDHKLLLEEIRYRVQYFTLGWTSKCLHLHLSLEGTRQVWGQKKKVLLKRISRYEHKPSIVDVQIQSEKTKIWI